MSRVLRIAFSVYALVVFVLLMFIVFPFVLITSLLGPIKAGNINFKIFTLWGATAYFLTGIRHSEIYLAPHNRNKQYIFIANHISYMDIPAIVRAIHQPVRVLGKYEMVKIPVFGLIYRTVVILVNRSSAEKRAKSIRAMKAAIGRGISIFIFPEGTFNETRKPLKAFYDGAFRIAIETQTPIKPVLFVDTHDRLHYRSLFSLTPGKCRCVFLDEIPVEGMQLSQLEDLKNLCYKTMDDALRKYRLYSD